jgi:hypothetical protein
LIFIGTINHPSLLAESLSSTESVFSRNPASELAQKKKAFSDSFEASPGRKEEEERRNMKEDE